MPMLMIVTGNAMKRSVGFFIGKVEVEISSHEKKFREANLAPF